mmetsp:Transcript_76310/g.170729  ORF Transcript_76310/g.170729 Transcript_76310/m.170729 type:complete len:237 (-) Transcript_76310:8-718(-)
MLMSFFGSTWPYWVRMISALALMPLTAFSVSSNAVDSTRSVLFSSTRSANATCSTHSFSTPSGFSSCRCSKTCLASTTVMMPSRWYTRCNSWSTKNVCATGPGSAKPVVSMITPSKPAVFVCSRLSACERSPRTVQQMQPFMTSMSCSSDASLMTFSSTPTSPNSFSMMAKRMPWSGDSRMWFRRVVFPDPKKPVRIVTGTVVRCLFWACIARAQGLGRKLQSWPGAHQDLDHLNT